MAANYAVVKFITAVSFISMFSLPQLPYRKINGNPVPTFIPKNLPSYYFHAVVVCLNLAFCSAVITIPLRQLYPKVAYLCRCACLLSMLASAGIFVSLAVPWAAGIQASPAIATA